MTALKRQIDLRPSFAAFLCAYYYFDPANSFFPFLFSAAAHEAGHFAALLLLRVPVQSVTLRAGGAEIQTPILSFRQELAAASAGPAVNLLLFFLLRRAQPMMSLINFCLLAYNLLPFYPLDGGRLLRATLCLLFRLRTARIVERCISICALLLLIGAGAYLTCAWHAGLWPILLCAILLTKIAVSTPEQELFCV